MDDALPAVSLGPQVKPEDSDWPRGFNWGAFFFPSLWPLAYKRYRLAATAFALWLGFELIRNAYLLLLVQQGASSTLQSYVLPVAVGCALGELCVSIWVGFTANRSYWTAPNPQLTVDDFLRRQPKWITWALALLALWILAWSVGPITLPGGARIGPALAGLDLSQNRLFVAGVDVVFPSGTTPIEPGVHSSIPVASDFGGPLTGQRLLIAPFPIDAGRPSVLNEGRTTLWTQYTVDGDRATRDECYLAMWEGAIPGRPANNLESIRITATTRGMISAIEVDTSK